MSYTVVCGTEDRAAWLLARMSGIGASEIAAACGESHWDSPFSLWARKSGHLPEKDESEPMRWGQLLEPVILAEYAHRSKRQAKPHAHLLRSNEYPWALATLDGTTWTANDPAWPLEIKSTAAHLADDWVDGPPNYYYLQVQQQILVTGADRCTSACLLGGNRLVWCDVDRDDRAIRKIIECGNELWQRVQSGDPPEVDGTEATLDALDAMYPKSHDGTICLDGDMMAIADEIAHLKEVAKEGNKRIAELEAAVKVVMGSHQRAVLPDGRAFTWATQKRGAYSVQASEIRVFRLVKPKKNKRTR